MITMEDLRSAGTRDQSRESWGIYLLAAAATSVIGRPSPLSTTMPFRGSVDKDAGQLGRRTYILLDLITQGEDTKQEAA